MVVSKCLDIIGPKSGRVLLVPTFVGALGKYKTIYWVQYKYLTIRLNRLKKRKKHDNCIELAAH